MKPRGFVAVSVLVAWGVGIALMIDREASRSPAERLAEIAMRVSPGATWFAVERDGKHVGFASITVDTIPRELLVTEYLVADSGAPRSTRYAEQTVVRLSRGLVLRGFSGVRARGTDTVRVEGHVAEDSAGSLSYVVDRGGRRETGEIPVQSGTALFLPQLVPLVTALRERPRVGRTSTLEVFDPDRGASLTFAVRVVGESLFVVVDSAVSNAAGARWRAVHRDTVRAWRLTSTPIDSGLDTWVDQLGQVVARQRPDGLTMRRTAFELAFENWRMASPARGIAARAGGDVVSGTLLGSGGAPPAAELDSLRVRVKTAPPRSLASRFGSQFRTNFAWTTTRQSERSLVSRYRLPTDAAWRRAFTRNLNPEPGIEVGDPAISHLARRLRGAESDPARVVGSLVRWVHDSIARDASAPAAGAAEVLVRRRGDATEFAKLFVALSRAAGVPARGVTGLLYAGGRFYYHAWSEAYFGRWVTVDPMLGQVPADAAHLAVLYDALDAEAELMRVLGRLDLAVVAAYPRESR